MLDAVYVDTVEEKSIVAIKPKPTFRPLFEIATTHEGSGIALVHESDRSQTASDPTHPCSWWRRRGVERYRERGFEVLLAA